MILYKILKIDRNSSKDEIKTAYRTLAKIYHPDMNFMRGSDVKFKAIRETYDILSNDDSRERYDDATRSMTLIEANNFRIDIRDQVTEAVVSDIKLSMNNDSSISFNAELLLVKLVNHYCVKLSYSPIDVKSIVDSEVETTRTSMLKHYFNVDKNFYGSNCDNVLKTNHKYDYKASESTQKTNEHEEEMKNNENSRAAQEDGTKKGHKKRGRYIFAFILTFSLLLFWCIFPILNGGNYLSQKQNKALTMEEQKEQEELSRVNEALLNPSLYWKIKYESPYEDNSFYVSAAYDESNKLIIDKLCVVVGFSIFKDKSSRYYLNDHHDNGIYNVHLRKFRIGQFSPSELVRPECRHILLDHYVQTFYSFRMTEGQVNYIYFYVDKSKIDLVTSLRYGDYDVTKLKFSN